MIKIYVVKRFNHNHFLTDSFTEAADYIVNSAPGDRSRLTMQEWRGAHILRTFVYDDEQAVISLDEDRKQDVLSEIETVRERLQYLETVYQEMDGGEEDEA